MSRVPRRVLVLAATRRALEQARALGFDGVLENAVQAEIAGKGLCGKVGREVEVPLPEHGLLVVVRRTTSTVSQRKAWIPLSVQRLDQRSAA